MAASDSPLTSKGYKWKEISDLPSDLESLRDRELESLSQVWADQKTAIEGEERIVAFNQELAREWAIETGIIEGVYTLDRGITETLIERGIDSSYISHDSTNRDPELVARIIQGHQAALEGLFAFVRGEREFGNELHQGAACSPPPAPGYGRGVRSVWKGVRNSAGERRIQEAPEQPPTGRRHNSRIQSARARRV